MKLLKIILGIFVISSLQASSLIKVECDLSGEQIYLDGKFKTECDSGELVKLLAPAGKHTLKAVKYNKDGSYYKFVKTFRLGDGVEKVISVNTKLNYTEKYYYKKAFNSLKDAKIYLEKYPYGNHSKEIKNYWDKNYFSKCSSIYGCQDYLNNISWGRYKTIAKNRIEKYYFQRCNDINGCETYLNKYPNGKYAKEVRKKLEKMYYERAKNDIYYADKFVKFFPKGKHISDIKHIRDNYYWKKCQDLDSCKIYVKKVPYGKHIKTAKEIVKNTWFKTYGGSGRDELRSIIDTKKGYFLVGNIFTKNKKYDGWVLYIDKNGNKIWSKNFGGLNHDSFTSVVKIEDKFILSGWTMSFGKGKADILIIEIDKNGNKLWEKTYGGNDSDTVLTSVNINNNDIIFAGWTKSFGYKNNGKDAWIIDFNIDNKTVKWKKIFGEKYADQINHILYLSPNQLVGIGKIYSKILFIKFNENGNISINKSYNNKYLSEEGISLINNDNNEFVIVGFIRDSRKNDTDAVILKIDNNGNLKWEKKYGRDENDVFTSIVKDKNGYIVAGWTWSQGNGKNDVWLMKIDENGNKIWEKTFGGKGIDFTWGLFKDKEGNLIIPANTYSYGAGSQDAWVIKISKELLKKWDEEAKATK